MHQLSILVEDNTDDVEYLCKAIDKLQNNFAHICTAEETEVVKLTCAVGKYSARYWDKNYDRWMVVLSGIDQNQMNQVQTKGLTPEEKTEAEILMSDIVGGATGAYTGAAVGAAGGTIVVPGIGTTGGAAAGAIGGALSGGLSASLTAGLIEAILDWF